MKNLFSTILFFVLTLYGTKAEATATKIAVKSPDGNTEITISIGGVITYSVTQDFKEIITSSALSMTLSDGTVWGVSPDIKSTERVTKDETINSPFYTSTTVRDNYNGVLISFTNEWGLEFRAYDDGVAYRFSSTKTGSYQIVDEQVEYKFTNDAVVTAPYVYESGDLETQLFQAFENTYTSAPISQLDKNRLMFLPLSVKSASDRRVTITESDLRDYPGMYLTTNLGKNTLTGFFAPLRDKVEEHAGYNNLQVIVKSRHNFIAQVSAPRLFPWRVAVITENDTDLANTSIVYKLAAPNIIGDTTWIKPGKVAWDWWNNWNLEGVDFKAGVNNETYKYYIDFASKYGLEYVILDEGWSVNKVYDLMRVVPEIDIKMLVDYAAEKGVGIILWAGYYAFDRDMEKVCKYYSELGVKGFKIDFMNGDDQELVYFNERSAAMTAKYKLLLDIHGTYKPTGLERTYPNILNFEGVHGLEQMKWQPATVDQVTYDVTMPYIRMISGPVDYTQGAMTNGIKTYNSLADTLENQYFPSFTKPMSQGTRVHQLAEYVIFFSPLNMLCDTPTNYEKNPISTTFIAEIPTVWDESKVIDGVLGEYIVTARRSGDKWYIGGLNNWDVRDITIDVKSITGKSGEATIYQDGLNAGSNGSDFKRYAQTVDGVITIPMAAGGGFVLVI